MMWNLNAYAKQDFYLSWFLEDDNSLNSGIRQCRIVFVICDMSYFLAVFECSCFASGGYSILILSKGSEAKLLNI